MLGSQLSALPNGTDNWSFTADLTCGPVPLKVLSSVKATRLKEEITQTGRLLLSFGNVS